MAKRDAPGIPAAIAGRRVRVVRPRDVADVYPNPRPELARLSRHGLLRRLAHGYFAIVPSGRVDDEDWRPSLDAAALAIGGVDYGVDRVALIGSSAARHHRLIPRALAIAYIAVPKQRPRVAMLRGEVRFVKRDVAGLDLERATTELGPGWVTTLEQTVLDLLVRRDGYGLSEDEIAEAVRVSLPRIDRTLFERLAVDQSHPSARRRFEEIAGNDRAAGR